MKPFRFAPPRGSIVNKENANPFVLTGNPERAVVFFPGLTRFAQDADLVAALLNKGAQAHFFAENLPGQDSFVEFANTRAWAMLAEAEKIFLKRYNEVGHPIVLMGVSTGALIAGILAARHPDKVRAVVLISAARTLFRKVQNLLWFGITAQWLFWPVHRWSNYWSIPAGSIADDPEGEEIKGRPYHTRIPMWTGSSIIYLQFHFGFALPQIECPVMIVRSKSDDIVPSNVADTILKDLQHPHSGEEDGESIHQMIQLERAPHVPIQRELLDTVELQMLEVGLLRFLLRVWRRPFKRMLPEERIAKGIRSSLRRKFGRFRTKPDGGHGVNGEALNGTSALVSTADIQSGAVIINNDTGDLSSHQN